MRSTDTDAAEDEGSVLFDASVDEGYQFYRIPSLLRVTAAAGTWLLAFCEGRQQLTDHGKVDIVLKRSADDGEGRCVFYNMVWTPCGTIAYSKLHLTVSSTVVAAGSNGEMY